MPPTRPPYPAELKRQIVELVRAGRNPSELARKSELILSTLNMALYQRRPEDVIQHSD